MKCEDQKELRDYAWKYFNIHAEQRLKTFHFFIIFATIVVGALLAAAEREAAIAYSVVLSYMLAFLTFIFWKLDVRNKELIKHGEAALAWLDDMLDFPSNGDIPPVIKLFAHEAWKTNKKRRFPAAPLLSAHMSYSDCFNAVFFVVGVGSFTLGCVLVAMSLR